MEPVLFSPADIPANRHGSRMVVPWGSLELGDLMDAPWKSHGSLMEVPCKSPMGLQRGLGRPMGVPRKPHENPMKAPWGSCGNLLRVVEELGMHGSTIIVPRKHHRSPREIRCQLYGDENKIHATLNLHHSPVGVSWKHHGDAWKHNVVSMVVPRNSRESGGSPMRVPWESNWTLEAACKHS